MIEKHETLEDLLGNTPQTKNFEGFLARGRIVAVKNDMAVIDAGLKSEGRVPFEELKKFENNPELRIGDDVDIYVDRLEDDHGEIVFSAEKAAREKIWMKLEKALKENGSVTGKIISHVKAGYAVDFGGSVIAFLPKSHIDVRPLSQQDVQAILNIPQEFKVKRMDRQRNNVVVSRRDFIEESRSGARDKFISELEEGQVVEGIVKNITDYGAFIDLGGIDGLLHIIDISWTRTEHPSKVFKIGDKVQVKVIRFNKETGRISLGMKQLEPDPWLDMKDKIQIGDILEGEVTNITDYGAFVEVFPGIEGLIYVTELSWTQKNAHPINYLKQGQKIKVMVMDVDADKRRISLSFKRCQANPWEAFAQKHPKGSIIPGVISNITEFGIFASLEDELDGMVHMEDLVWEGDPDEVVKSYQKGQNINVMVIDINPDKERITLGIKQLTQKSASVESIQ